MFATQSIEKITVNLKLNFNPLKIVEINHGISRLVHKDFIFSDTVLLSPTQPGPSSPVPSIHPVAPSQPALSGNTTPRRARPMRRLRTPRRRVRPAHTEQAVQHFLHAEEEQRKMKMQQHRDYMEIRREQNRIRDMEVQASREWRELGSRGMDLFEKFINKYCRDD